MIHLIRPFVILILLLNPFFTIIPAVAQGAHTSTSNEYEVVVIGGGISGLATVNALAEKGIKNVLLLEKENRFGGKIWTERSTQDSINSYYERGAELVNTSDTELIDLIQSLGLSLTERRFKHESRNEILLFKERFLGTDGKIIEGNLRAYSFLELLAKMHEFPQDIKVLDILNQLQIEREKSSASKSEKINSKLRSLTAESILESGLYTKSFFSALIQSEFGVSLNQINAEVLLDYVKLSKLEDSGLRANYSLEIIPSSDEKFRVTNGTDTIITALYKKYQNQVKLNSQIEGVEQLSPAEFKITIKTNSLQPDIIKAQHVVFAVPAYELSKINISSPHLSSERIQQAAALPFAHNAKIFLTFKNKFWDKSYKNNPHSFAGAGMLESGIQFWDTTENQKHSKEGIITLYPGKWPLKAADQNSRLQQILSDLNRVPGLENLEQYLVKVDVHNWQKSYAGVFNSFYSKSPILFAEKLPANIYFVGSDKDNDLNGRISEFYGYMNGAVRTALRATNDILKNSARSLHPRIKNINPKVKKIGCAPLFLGTG